MQQLKDKYQIEETAFSFSFKPFHQDKKKLKWYALATVILAGFMFGYFNQIGDTYKIIVSVLLSAVAMQFFKDLIFKINVVYTFDKSANAVYKSNSPFGKRKIMSLDEVVVFQSSEMGGWHYAIGAKKKQFIKNYAISEEFGSGKKSDEKATAFEDEILEKIMGLKSTIAQR